MNYILIGRGGHGKDTAKEIIEKHKNVEQIRMADYLKFFLIEVFELDQKNTYKNYHKSNNKWYDNNNNFIANELLDILKEEKNFYIDKEREIELDKDFRTIMQKLGTEYFRNLIDQDFHVKMVLKKILNSNSDFIFTDIRFDNEKDSMYIAGIEENKEELNKFSNSIKITKSFAELKKDFYDIILGNSKISKKIENNLDKHIKKILKLNTGHSLKFKDLNLNTEHKEGNSKTIIVQIFRVIDENSFEIQKEMYLKFADKIKELYNLDVNKENELKKAMNIIGYIRTGMDDVNKVFHISEQELSLNKPYTEYKNIIAAQNLNELETKLLKYLNINTQINNEVEPSIN
jgi:hypothetical protein